jgi:dolichyl-diphosphooligosaccharide--protein glycosyltransferase
VPVVGFNAVLMSEHFGAFFAFVVLHIALAVRYVRGVLSPAHFWRVAVAVLGAGAAVLGLGLAVVIAYVLKSPTLGWTGKPQLTERHHNSISHCPT